MWMRLLLLFWVLSSPLHAYVPKGIDIIQLNKLVGQMIIVGFQGTTPENVDPALIQAIQNGKIGGLIFYDRNIQSREQVKTLIAFFKNLNPGLFISLDEEGGEMQTLGASSGFKVFPSAQNMAKLPPDEAKALDTEMLHMIKEAGFNLVFGPVVDLNINPEGPEIGAMERSFSRDPAVVIQYAALYLEAAKEAGVLTALKHFPGNGSARGNTHHGLTDVTSTWEPVELDPYKAFIDNHMAQAIMTAHILDRKLDPNDPTTLSVPILQGLLRDKLGFQGVIVSGDLCMGAMVRDRSFEEIVILSISAGCNIVLFSLNPEAIQMDPVLSQRFMKPEFMNDLHKMAVDAVISGAIPWEAILTSFKKIEALKARIRL